MTQFARKWFSPRRKAYAAGLASAAMSQVTQLGLAHGVTLTVDRFAAAKFVAAGVVGFVLTHWVPNSPLSAQLKTETEIVAGSAGVLPPAYPAPATVYRSPQGKPSAPPPPAMR